MENVIYEAAHDNAAAAKDRMSSVKEPRSTSADSTGNVSNTGLPSTLASIEIMIYISRICFSKC